MSPRREKILRRVISGSADANIPFSDLCHLLDSYEFQCRIKGSHHIYWRGDLEEIVNIQPRGSKAKAYQVKQVRNLLLKYKLVNPDES